MVTPREMAANAVAVSGSGEDGLRRMGRRHSDSADWKRPLCDQNLEKGQYEKKFC